MVLPATPVPLLRPAGLPKSTAIHHLGPSYKHADKSCLQDKQALAKPAQPRLAESSRVHSASSPDPSRTDIHTLARVKTPCIKTSSPVIGIPYNLYITPL